MHIYRVGLFIKILITLDNIPGTCNFHNGLIGEAFIKGTGNHHHRR